MFIRSSLVAIGFIFGASLAHAQLLATSASNCKVQGNTIVPVVTIYVSNDESPVVYVAEGANTKTTFLHKAELTTTKDDKGAPTGVTLKYLAQNERTREITIPTEGTRTISFGDGFSKSNLSCTGLSGAMAKLLSDFSKITTTPTVFLGGSVATCRARNKTSAPLTLYTVNPNPTDLTPLPANIIAGTVTAPNAKLFKAVMTVQMKDDDPVGLAFTFTGEGKAQQVLTIDAQGDANLLVGNINTSYSCGE